MGNRARYTVVGVFVLSLSALFIFIFFWFSGAHHDKVYRVYLTYVHGDVTGLSLHSPVRFSGVQVGYVSEIALDPKNPQLVKLTLKIEAGTPVTVSTFATLMPMGITGVVYVRLKAQTSNVILLSGSGKRKPPVIPFKSSFLMQLNTLLPELAQNLKDITHDISKLLNQQNREAISASLQNLELITENASRHLKKLDGVIISLQLTMKNVMLASTKLPGVLDQLSVALKSIRNTSIDLSAASKSTILLFNQTQVMMGGFNTHLFPSIQQMLLKLNTVLLNLSSITQEFQRNPALLIRGKQAAQLGPGEK